MPIVIGALKRLDMMRSRPEFRNKLWEITNALQTGLRNAGFNMGASNSPVTPIFMNGSLTEASNMLFDLRENHGIFCSVVVYPVVPKGTIIIRIIPTAVHTLEDVNYTINAFNQIVSKLKEGGYQAAELGNFTKY
jgi:glycine C-acetyltransferase